MDQNQSSLIRAPYIYSHIPWKDSLGYEVLVLEKVFGDKLVTASQISIGEDVRRFFEFYSEYNQHCIHIPWIENSYDFTQTIKRIWHVHQKLDPEKTSHITQTDRDQITQAEEKLLALWKNSKPIFAHTHLSVEDAIQDIKHIVIFSNLFWRWTHPYYDLVFGYHWFMISLVTNPDISEVEFSQQKKLWLDHIFASKLVQMSQDTDLLEAALVERAIAGLLVDGTAYVEPRAPLRTYLLDSYRKDIETFLR